MNLMNDISLDRRANYVVKISKDIKKDWCNLMISRRELEKCFFLASPDSSGTDQ